MTSPVPATPTSPPTEAVEAAMTAMGCVQVSRIVHPLLSTVPSHICLNDRHHGSWTDAGCPVAVSVAAAVVAALVESGWTPGSQTDCVGCSDLPARDRETAAKALDDLADSTERNSGWPERASITPTAIRARATALREGDNR